MLRKPFFLKKLHQIHQERHRFKNQKSVLLRISLVGIPDEVTSLQILEMATLNTFWAVLGGLLLLVFLIILIRVYNECKRIEISLDELLANSDSTRIKLNNVYAEIYKLLGKYSVHESDIHKFVASGQANIKLLATQYPQLKADSIFNDASLRWSQLYTELQGYIEKYNREITAFNTYTTNFPRVIFCRIIKRTPRKHAKIT